jgi:hypothetical protein
VTAGCSALSITCGAATSDICAPCAICAICDQSGKSSLLTLLRWAVQRLIQTDPKSPFRSVVWVDMIATNNGSTFEEALQQQARYAAQHPELPKDHITSTWHNIPGMSAHHPPAPLAHTLLVTAPPCPYSPCYGSWHGRQVPASILAASTCS